MAKKSMIAKFQRGSKFTVRNRNRCLQCGRPRSYIRQFGLCRICFRKNANFGLIPGVKKISW